MKLYLNLSSTPRGGQISRRKALKSGQAVAQTFSQNQKSKLKQIYGLYTIINKCKINNFDFLNKSKINQNNSKIIGGRQFYVLKSRHLPLFEKFIYFR